MQTEKVLAIDKMNVTISRGVALRVLPINYINIYASRDLRVGDIVTVKEASGGSFGYPSLFLD